MANAVDIRKTIRGPLPRIPFEEMARAVLGADCELSLVLCGDALARSINIKYRRKHYSPNVLSFPIAPKEGEIFLNLRKAEREARTYGVTPKERVALLYVHGLFHLKGLDHGDKMEAAERNILRRFHLDTR